MNLSAETPRTIPQRASNHAFKILRFAFTIAPIIGGIDKFFNFLTNWPDFFSPYFIFGSTTITMMVVGVIEIIIGIGVWFKPRIFAYITALWLFGIIINLLVLGQFYEKILTDFNLALAALALGCLSKQK